MHHHVSLLAMTWLCFSKFISGVEAKGMTIAFFLLKFITKNNLSFNVLLRPCLFTSHRLFKTRPHELQLRCYLIPISTADRGI